MSNFCRTKILASIKSLKEISLVLKKGVDIIDFKNSFYKNSNGYVSLF